MKYYLKKILGFIFTILLVSIITFVVFQILPGDPAQIILGVDADPAQIENLRATMNLDKGYVERYLIWLTNALKGDLGVSYRYSRAVSELISESFFVTSSLAVYSIALTILIGLPLGIFIAKNSKKKITTGISMLSQLGISVPSFCMGIVLISIFSVNLGWFDSIGYIPASESLTGWFKTMFLPSLSIAFGSSAVLARYIRVSIANQQKQDYVRTAKSKGLSEKIIMNQHILRNSLIPVITILGMLVADILGGSIIIENVFSLPGIGKLISTSITTRDLPLIQGLTVYLAGIVVICNFGVDILYSIIDPRIKTKR
ncbi:ABC transporter permease [uncultured Negativibacillus sp.]|uniref:ABC transporter permease n=1 Tax=uncultured Negativibacillus sp. TaxID=1980696 RepID=UPI0025E5FAF9|nr:ABC transporter permease [uncultured Negativibacillus sp.]